MNEHADGSELPELRDEDVELLYAICKRASESSDPPFKSLFAAYDDIFEEHQIEQEHDGVVFRYLMRVGETTRAANRERRPVDLVKRLRNVLEAQGITVVDPREDGPEEASGTVDQPNTNKKTPYQSPKRRVSFDDARFEETWLSEHSAPINPAPPQARPSLLSLPPRRGRGVTSARRTRSTSSQRNLSTRNPAPKHFQQVSTDYVSEPDDPLNPTLYFEPSQTQLEQNAEAFLSTSVLRAGRKSLRLWRDNALQVQQERSHAYSIAATHDRRILLSQTMDQWRATLQIRQQDHRRAEHYKRQEEKSRRARDLFLLTKAFTHWATSCAHEKLKTTVGLRHVLKVTYFKRWRAIASENQMKVRRILLRKYFAVWRERIARRLLWQEQAVAHYEETLLKRCKTRWFWEFCSRRVEGWNEQWVEKRAFGRLVNCFDSRRQQQRQAEDLYHSHRANRTLRVLCDRLQRHRQDLATAQQHHDRPVISRNLRDLHIRTKLAPLAQSLTPKVNINLQRKSIKVWRLHADLSRQAAEVDRKRVLQSAWTDWNDALRCKALAQKIDERVVIENLYRWVLQERLRLFQRTIDGRLLGRAFGWWLAEVRTESDRLADAEIVFAERQRRRSLAFGMLRLNITIRNREDAERAALELGNSRALPKVLNAWKEKTDHARRLAKWAADARFYCLSSSTLRVWKDKTNEHKQNRRRDTYVQIRAKVKIRLVGQCFMRWRTKCTKVHSINAEAERRARGRLTEVATKAFDCWRDKSVEYANLSIQATDMDKQKLVASVLSAMVVKHADLRSMDHQALDFRRETDVALLASALKRVQWSTFTAARKAESADALWARNRDQHVKQMLRHWAGQAATRRATARGKNDLEGPESPSLRPASRAASRSADFAPPSSPPPQGAVLSTPGYMKTPSRSRRAGRFRALPAPAPFTPMAFDAAYFASTPAPISTVESEEIDQSFEGSTAGLTPQVTPFARKLKAGGFTPGPPSALRSSVFGRTTQGESGTSKSVRFAGASRFRTRDDDGHVKKS